MAGTTVAVIPGARGQFHARLLASQLTMDKAGIPSNADKDGKTSVKIGRALLRQLGTVAIRDRLPPQTAGAMFEATCAAFLRETFLHLHSIRPGHWEVISQSESVGGLNIASFDQYSHLADLAILAKKNPDLAVVLGTDYIIKPDVLISRQPEGDDELNRELELVDREHALRSSLRKLGDARPLLHASVSCKWTIRSDRAQNARSEALNLIRNRKGRLPHIVVVTAAPEPTRIASLALGTGDIDCVYHFALPELINAVQEEVPKQAALLENLVNGRRLRDIADLPLDLAV